MDDDGVEQGDDGKVVHVLNFRALLLCTMITSSAFLSNCLTNYSLASPISVSRSSLVYARNCSFSFLPSTVAAAPTLVYLHSISNFVCFDSILLLI